MKINRLLLSFSICLLIGTTACNETPNKEADIQTDYLAESKNSSEVAKCSAKWFPHSQTPAPAEGKGSHFDTSSTTNAIFHEWSWQKFLWLTKPDVKGIPFFVNHLTWIENNLKPAANPVNAAVVLTSDEQAAFSAVLMSNPTFNSSEAYTIYYGLAANDILLQASKSYLDSIVNKKQYNNSFTFPVSALEVKSAWVAADAIPPSQINNYYVADSYITLTKERKKMALLGIHVVGVVENHPEFIWATFEHASMAPNYDWTNTTDTTNDVAVTSNQNLLLFEKGSKAGIEDITYSKPPTFKNVFSVFPYGIPKTLHDSIMPNLAQSTSSNLSNLNNIQRLNQCARQELAKEKSVWANYFYNGSIWMNMDGKSQKQQVQLILDPNIYLNNATTGKPMRGSLAAFNITMETFFQQSGQKKIAAMESDNVLNCFTCHTSTKSLNNNQYHSPLYISHIFRNAVGDAIGMSAGEIKKLRVKETIKALSAHE